MFFQLIVGIALIIIGVCMFMFARYIRQHP
jgi:uncharacterized membrane protein HdeD (DUF308 family)